MTLSGNTIGHTAPKTKEVLKRADGRRCCFIDEASLPVPAGKRARLRPGRRSRSSCRVMENQREDLVRDASRGYKGRMDTFFQSNPGPRLARRACHIDFPDYTVVEELGEIAGAW